VRSDYSLSPATSYDRLSGENCDQVQPRSCPPRSQSDLRLINNPIEVIRRIHRGDGAVVAFQHKDLDGRWLDMAAVKISELQAIWPKLVSHFAIDDYMQINSIADQPWMKAWAAKIGKPSLAVCERTGLPRYFRTTKHLLHLNALKLDFDWYKQSPALTAEQFFEEFDQKRLRLHLPTPNVICFSGRGKWVLYLLRDHYNLQIPPPKHRLDVYKRVQTALHQAFVSLGSDPAAKNPVGVMRAWIHKQQEWQGGPFFRVVGALVHIAGARYRAWSKGTEDLRPYPRRQPATPDGNRVMTGC
jgi:hypothetical protein